MFHSMHLLRAFAPVAFCICVGACGGGSANGPSPAIAPTMAAPSSCALASPGPASTQTRVRLGFYYFDGWSGPLTNFHFKGLPGGMYAGREPVTGWQDNSACAVEQQLAFAHRFGINFFVFDWYFNAAVVDPGENLNSALQITHSLPDRHGMQFAILYVDGPPFVAGPADWPDVIAEWTGYMSDPAYVRVNGKPLLIVLDIDNMHQAFGSSAATASAFAQLKAVAQAKGLPGVFIAGVFGVAEGSSGQDALFPDPIATSVADGYDALTMYNYPFVPPVVNGMEPYANLSAAGHWIWEQCAVKCPLPAIPVVTDGWDPRPWNGTDPNGNLVWYDRTAQGVSADIHDTIALSNNNAMLRLEPAPSPPMVLVEAWNELGEGSYIVPTVGDGTAYGDALSGMLTQ